jgi:3-deoxy-D-manno-octulosonic-acid transferase
MSLLYDILFLLVVIITFPVWGFKLWRTGKWKTDWAGRFGKTDFKPDGRPVLLVHCVSVGETNAVRQMIDHIDRISQSKVRVVISVTTDTGIARARQLYEPKHTVVRYPLDIGFSVRRFLDTVQPASVALTELEVWPNFVKLCSQRNIPVNIVNGRLSARSFKNYRKIRCFIGPTFRRLGKVSAQTQAYADRFIFMGTDPANVTVGDTMKWDTANVDPIVPGAEDLAREMGIDITGKIPLIVAGSIAPGEDELLLKACPQNAQLLMAPRKPELFADIEKIAPGIIRRTAHGPGTLRPVDGSRLFFLDTIGELKKAYSLADVVVVGRSFLGLYGSDMMEPVALGKPTLVGPFHSDFQETVEALTQAQGIIVTDDPGKTIRELLADPIRAKQLADNGRRAIIQRQGASLRNAQMLLNTGPFTV